jgi:hypothetical protein
MKRLASVLALVVLLLAAILLSAHADQTATCRMDDNTHVAKYSCPDGYEVVYTGEGTKTCDGSCFKKGDSKSLKDAVWRMAVRRFGEGAIPAVAESLNQVTTELLSEGHATLRVGDKGVLQLRVTQ